MNKFLLTVLSLLQDKLLQFSEPAESPDSDSATSILPKESELISYLLSHLMIETITKNSKRMKSSKSLEVFFEKMKTKFLMSSETFSDMTRMMMDTLPSQKWLTSY